MSDETPKEEKTEDATPKKLEEAREKGSVAISQEFIAAMMLVGAGVSMSMGGPQLLESIGGLTARTVEQLGELSRGEITVPDAAIIMKAQVMGITAPLLLTLAPMLAVGLVAGYGQIGFRIAGKALEFDLTKLDPIKGSKRLLGARGAMRLGLAMLKLVAITAALVTAVYLQLPRVFDIAGNELGPSLRGGMSIILVAAAAALIVILLISVLDLIYQRRQFAKDNRMSKSEVKREHKQDEGDPHVKARVRQIQREMATGRMMQEVPEATVVVTNPTHYAVALSYEPDAEGNLPAAPRVVAKGVDDLAQHIKAIATQADVPLYEDVPLARALYAKAEVGDMVPADLFQAVATVIQYVWRLEGRGPKAEAQGA
ncbi:EscU/YscU/HrcU family type III secretion system export apparatus switch protein [Engelhardtia mirabilis]|uniref:Flagellar biosynthetic protein FlhB n=1 Tax=Engelhardtia mirabilis TaxID=2528011 RepID=A0A518BSR8_9BACT|nr:Flagellar biosynthetic protein FlhB [Planctomycetes bacterium Pla133]QDV04330.1 Flagellar biosynthetic protein FlhB [Planctomycetes bacterium Pla86]